MVSFILAMIGAILILLVLTPAYAYYSKYPKHKTIAIVVKGVTTGICFAFGLAGFLMLNKLTDSSKIGVSITSSYWAIIGLFFCILADIFLVLNFITGGVFFFLGHLAYIIFFIALGGFHTISIVVYTLLCVATLCYFYRYTAVLKRFHLLFALYGMMILATLTLGILLPFTFGFYGLLPAAASLLLVGSDFILARNKLFEETKFSRFLALSCYFGGQYLIAMTLYLAAFLA